MKSLLVILMAVMWAGPAWSQSNDDLAERVKALEAEVETLRGELATRERGQMKLIRRSDVESQLPSTLAALDAGRSDAVVLVILADPKPTPQSRLDALMTRLENTEPVRFDTPESGPARVHTELVSVRVDGIIDRNRVRHMLLDHVDAVASCHAAADMGFRGEVEVAFTVGSSGRARELSVTHDALPEGLEPCLTSVVTGPYYPRPTGADARIGVKLRFR